MDCQLRNSIEISQSICEKLQPTILPLLKLFDIKTLGYRKFYLDGTSFGFSNNDVLTKFWQEKFDKKIIPNYANEVSSVVNREKMHFFRMGIPDPQNLFLSCMYDLNIWNTLSFYRKSPDGVEGFYFASTKENQKIIESYLNNMNLFDRFSLYFKNKISDIMSEADMKNASSLTVSPKSFILNNTGEDAKKFSLQDQRIKDFIELTPLHKFYLNIKGQEVSLSGQEFKCLALLSRGKSAKEVGSILNISSRTVEGYLENIKNKTKVCSRSRLIDLFILDFYKTKEWFTYLEN